ncbi:MAG TPA: ABC transporter ATP-binding protein, partial [Thermoanaerobacterales bacterium]|nr:ABC transporter ATP-binding protein [Thermoanaerobacterales bacterium]
MGKLYSYLKPYWKAVLLAPLLMLVEVAMDLLQPRLIASIINEGILKQDLIHIRNIGILMVGAAIIGLLGGIGCIIFASKAGYSFGADLRTDLFDKIQSFSFRNLDDFKTGSLITRLTNDIVQIQNVVIASLRMLIRAPFLAIGSFIMALTISPKLSLILIVIIPILAVVLLIVIRKAFPLFRKVQSKIDNLNTVLQENFSGIRVVKAFVRTDFEEYRFGNENDELMDITIKATRLIALIIPIMMFLLNITVVAIIWFGGLQVWEGVIEIGDIVALINYITQILFSLLMVGMMLMFVSRAKASTERINEVLEAEPNIENINNPKKDAVKFGEVLFDDVSFSYSNSIDNLVLKNINFVAKPGQIDLPEPVAP